jgi:hypothetical protein
MNCRSLVSLKLKNGSTDLNNYFFILFALLQGWFKKKKKSEKLPGKLKNSGKTESAFFCGNGWNDLAIVIYIRVRDVNFPARQLVSGTMAQPSA